MGAFLTRNMPSERMGSGCTFITNYAEIPADYHDNLIDTPDMYRTYMACSDRMMLVPQTHRYFNSRLRTVAPEALDTLPAELEDLLIPYWQLPNEVCPMCGAANTVTRRNFHHVQACAGPRSSYFPGCFTPAPHPVYECAHCSLIVPVRGVESIPLLLEMCRE